MKIGIIGFGRLGRLIAKQLVKDAEVFVFDTTNYAKETKKIGATWASLDEVCACPIVIPFVPISSFEKVIKKIAIKLSPKTLVIDVCSVKELPVQIMKKYLPKDIYILGTHPMFGPDSARLTLYGAKIILSKVRMPEKAYQGIKGYLMSHGLHVIEATPEQHDKQVVRSLTLTHFIGRSLVEFGAEDLLIDTKGYRRLMKILETVINDSWQLFSDMNHYNPYAKKMRQDYIKAVKKIDQQIIGPHKNKGRLF
jgi:prephenate dehydrogenase